ncbi:DUF975 family protein [Latilactobacillus graminis]|uniref:Integral membrane protein n=2 Tax=Latilactobacillus graminis TaxID=60519 RepID=A0AA89L176_9LACO|nr:DUF975 family protein [Latilactobacillus graminis]KRM24148.1 hypothetical protein FC90_GL000624 [Latilactobacillus graminis DSM 20719]QFP78865.1 DUF975 family protein [Latilactobacillus graminis]
MDIEHQSRASLKRTVKKLFSGHWGKAVTLNLIPTILSILSVIVIGAFVLFLIVLFADTSTMTSNSAFSDSSVSSNNFTSYIPSFILGLITVGINFTFLDWLRSKDANFKTLQGAFSVFSKRYFLGVFLTRILGRLFIFLWTLLLIIPGIIKAYAYSQALYIFKDLTDNPQQEEVNYLDCLTKSRALMKGHKFRLFVLKLSFLGWDILATLSLGIGYLWLTPYKNATYMAFYKDLAGNQFLQTPSTDIPVEVA